MVRVAQPGPEPPPLSDDPVVALKLAQQAIIERKEADRRRQMDVRRERVQATPQRSAHLSMIRGLRAFLRSQGSPGLVTVNFNKKPFLTRAGKLKSSHPVTKRRGWPISRYSDFGERYRNDYTLLLMEDGSLWVQNDNSSILYEANPYEYYADATPGPLERGLAAGIADLLDGLGLSWDGI